MNRRGDSITAPTGSENGDGTVVTGETDQPTALPSPTTVLDSSAYAPFVDAVVRQLTQPPDPSRTPDAERGAARASVALALAGAVGGRGSPDFEVAARQLSADARLLSILYQNLDLLPLDDVASNGVAILIGEALEPSTPSS